MLTTLTYTHPQALSTEQQDLLEAELVLATHLLESCTDGSVLVRREGRSICHHPHSHSHTRHSLTYATLIHPPPHTHTYPRCLYEERVGPLTSPPVTSIHLTPTHPHLTFHLPIFISHTIPTITTSSHSFSHLPPASQYHNIALTFLQRSLLSPNSWCYPTTSHALSSSSAHCYQKQASALHSTHP